MFLGRDILKDSSGIHQRMKEEIEMTNRKISTTQSNAFV